jgi:hypothetical protein
VLRLPPGQVTARQLIEAAVTAEVASYQARAEEASLVRVLTQRSLAGDLDRGAVRMGWPDQAGEAAAGEVAAVDVTAAVDAALLGFSDGFFKLFVGDDEITGDDSVVSVADGTALLFLRLVPLAGG